MGTSPLVRSHFIRRCNLPPEARHEFHECTRVAGDRHVHRRHRHDTNCRARAPCASAAAAGVVRERRPEAPRAAAPLKLATEASLIRSFTGGGDVTESCKLKSFDNFAYPNSRLKIVGENRQRFDLTLGRYKHIVKEGMLSSVYKTQ
ncbi:hypothetical protein EVAR_14883_1 [Eumeta japonica]|uniref:Uncharacterized protein n=1 Tax=Eumeta variegata TaxID=151549 RepID=A0A4C1V4I8_EUMVA|nr:hypothetical protein EVAR_14883_1 [Eumeta japonica]